MQQTVFDVFETTAKYGVSLSEILDQLVGVRNGCYWPISLATTASKVRELMPGCYQDNHYLTERIAIYAIEHGRCVNFDADLLPSTRSTGS